VIGFAFIVWSYFWVAVYTTTMYEPVPGWVFVNCAISLFIYQTMDAVDGKQARRADCASPLGELVDHGKINSYNQRV